VTRRAGCSAPPSPSPSSTPQRLWPAFAPPGATLDAAVRRRWARRFGLTVGVVVASWALIAGIDRADTGPNGPLFVAGLTALGAGALAFRRSGRPS
jgi:hypothetical protein